MFKKAVRGKVKARIALCGPTGSGKTMTSLTLAAALNEGGGVALVDTERSSASLYADRFDFDTCNLTDLRPETFGRTIRAADEAGYDVLIIDSLSHAWEGVLEELDKASRGGNTFNAWRDVTPRHKDLVNTILDCNMHVIATLRSKMEYAMETNDRGKVEVTKVGLSPVQRSGLEYEFDLVFSMDQSHTLVVTKSRFDELADQSIPHPDERFGTTVKEAISTGVEVVRPTEKEIDLINKCLSDLGMPADDAKVRESAIGKSLGLKRRVPLKSLTQAQARESIVFLEGVLAKRGEEQEAKAKADAKAEADRIEANEAAELAAEEGDDLVDAPGDFEMNEPEAA